mgnify:FL=1
MKKYISDRNEIPKENHIEISYNELSNHPINSIEKIYNHLDLGDFKKVKPNIIKYLSSIKDYKKNKFNTLSEQELIAINERWGFSFEEWSYSKQIN